MRLTELTTVELQRLAHHVLRRYLDVTSGAAPPGALAPYLAPAAAAELHRLSDNPPSSAVRHADLGPVTVLRLGPNRAYAATPVARGASAEVVSIELEAHGQRIVAVRIGEAATRWQRLQRPVPAVGPGQPPPAVPAHLAGLLGDVPSDAAALLRWVAAAAVIDTYRERYGINDVGSSFGPTPTDPEQAQERARALTHVRELAAGIEAIDPQQERGIGREPTAGPELGR